MYPNPQDVIPLPPNPNLQQYKKQAKDLVKACKSSERAAIRSWAAEWLANLTRLQDLSVESTPEWIQGGADQVAEFAHAKLSKSESGKLKGALADAQFVIARAHGFKSWPTFARHIEALTLAGSPVSRFELAADAIIIGDLAQLQRLLREDPELIRTRSTREHGATLLHYVSANGVENFRQKTPKNAVTVTEILLKRGAEVDAAADVYGGGSTTLGLVATSIYPWLAGVQNAMLEVLLDHGASIDGLPGGWNPLVAALHNDRPEAAAFLAARGASLDLEGAAGVGRLDVVKSFFRDDSVSASDSKRLAQLQSGFIWACEYGREQVVEFLLDKGVDLRAGENTGQTALHLAAHRGQLEIIKLLLDRGAPLEAKNVYGGTVLGQATWSVVYGQRSIDFVPVIETLLAAGAKIEEADYPTGNERIDELLRRHK